MLGEKTHLARNVEASVLERIKIYFIGCFSIDHIVGSLRASLVLAPIFNIKKVCSVITDSVSLVVWELHRFFSLIHESI